MYFLFLCEEKIQGRDNAYSSYLFGPFSEKILVVFPSYAQNVSLVRKDKRSYPMRRKDTCYQLRKLHLYARQDCLGHLAQIADFCGPPRQLCHVRSCRLMVTILGALRVSSISSIAFVESLWGCRLLWKGKTCTQYTYLSFSWKASLRPIHLCKWQAAASLLSPPFTAAYEVSG